MTVKKQFILTALASLMMTGTALANPPSVSIPTLNWTERSDWLDVTDATDMSPDTPAAGDGVTDDTDALQAALDRLDPYSTTTGDVAVVYLPAGTYRITDTLELSTRIPGGAFGGGIIIGHGDDTRIVWDGANGGTMVLTHNISRIQFIGQVWDGDDTAAYAFDHASASDEAYQTLMRHEHQAFMNFTDAAIRTRSDLGRATAEVYFMNCLFSHCDSGVMIGDNNGYNCYDNYFDGCEFHSCGTGINCLIGNIYVNNCHFEYSTDTDIYTNVSIHGKQIRRCTSYGSYMFYKDTGNPWIFPYSNHQIFQDCWVDSWTNTSAAAQFTWRGPTTLFDCKFTTPPQNAQPPVLLVDNSDYLQTLILSNVSVGSSTDVADIVRRDVNDSRVYEIPYDSATNLGTTLSSATQRFLKETWTIPGTIYDAKAYGAVGDGVTDDTDAIQDCIDAARTAGNNAIAYLPKGKYLVSDTIEIYGSDYFIEGAGYVGTRIFLPATINPSNFQFDATDSTKKAVFHVDDPDNIVIKNMGFMPKIILLDYDEENEDLLEQRRALREDVAWIWQTGDDSEASIIYDRIASTNKYNDRGWVFSDLPRGARVLAREITGCLEADSASRAAILTNVYYNSGSYTIVEGDEPYKDGIFGITASTGGTGLVDTSIVPDIGTITYNLVVSDNQNVTWANFYQESANKHILLEGSSSLPPGRVSITGPKCESFDQVSFVFDDYYGRFFHSSADISKQDESEEVEIDISGSNPIDIMFVGASFRYGDPTFTNTNNYAQIILAGNDLWATSINDGQEVVTDQNVTGNLDLIAEAFDDFRELGLVYAAFNHSDQISHLTFGAHTFSPAEDSVHNNNVTLSWQRSDWDRSYDVYLGTSYSTVNAADDTSQCYVGNQADTSYSPTLSNQNQVYYWRVDTKSALETEKGDVHSFVVVASGAVYNATQDTWHTTIQSAITAASTSDVLYAGDGTFTGTGNKNISFSGKAITLQSINGAASTTVDCQGSGRGFIFNNSEGTGSVLDGFTITNADSGMLISGGGIYMSGSSPTIQNCIIDGNDAGLSGGGIYSSGGTPTITNCTVSDNFATGSGGGIYCEEGDISNCVISGNSANNGAGGLECGDDSVVVNCAIIGNDSQHGGGGAHIKDDATLVNCLVADNAVTNTSYGEFGGGGIACEGSISIINCTIVNNDVSATHASGEGLGGGIYFVEDEDQADTPTIVNSVIWGNTASDEGDNIYLFDRSSYSHTLTVSYSDVEGGQAGVVVGSNWTLSWGTGNDNSAPLFVDEDGADNDSGTWADNDYRLTSSSPCVDAGDDNSVPTGVTEDLDGNDRIVDGDGDYTDTVDMGSYEYQP